MNVFASFRRCFDKNPDIRLLLNLADKGLQQDLECAKRIDRLLLGLDRLKQSRGTRDIGEILRGAWHTKQDVTTLHEFLAEVERSVGSLVDVMKGDADANKTEDEALRKILSACENQDTGLSTELANLCYRRLEYRAYVERLIVQFNRILDKLRKNVAEAKNTTTAFDAAALRSAFAEQQGFIRRLIELEVAANKAANEISRYSYALQFHKSDSSFLKYLETDPIAGLTSDDSDAIQSACQEAVRLDLTEALPLLDHLLAHHVSSVRGSAASALGLLGAKRSARKICALLHDQEELTVQRALLALEQLRAPETFEKVVAILGIRGENIDHFALAALAAIDEKKSVRYLEDIGTKFKNVSSQAKVVQILARITRDEAYLRKAVQLDAYDPEENNVEYNPAKRAYTHRIVSRFEDVLGIKDALEKGYRGEEAFCTGGVLPSLGATYEDNATHAMAATLKKMMKSGLIVGVWNMAKEFQSLYDKDMLSTFKALFGTGPSEIKEAKTARDVGSAVGISPDELRSRLLSNPEFVIRVCKTQYGSGEVYRQYDVLVVFYGETKGLEKESAWDQFVHVTTAGSNMNPWSEKVNAKPIGIHILHSHPVMRACIERYLKRAMEKFGMQVPIYHTPCF